VATIKLQEGRVLTRVRDGRTFVQCECCTQIPPEECCMYPIEKLDILFTEDDWPEEGVFYHNNTGPLSGPFTLERNSGTGANGEKLIYGNFGALNVGGRAIYYFPSAPDEYQRRQDQIDPGGGSCLFDDLFDEENQPAASEGGGADIWWFDNFEDAYTVTQTQPARTFTVTRESLCIWRSRNANGDVDNVLYYDTKANEQNLANNGGVLGRILWRFNGVYRTDAGPYNSPEGVYGVTDTWTVVG
jgi:hypothetical protein